MYNIVYNLYAGKQSCKTGNSINDSDTGRPVSTSSTEFPANSQCQVYHGLLSL